MKDAMRAPFSIARVAWPPIIILFLMPWLGRAAEGKAAPLAKPNVLFIAVDDLNHWVGHLRRNPQTITPNLDRLAARGVSFTRAYCAAPACNPSRAALMSGLRPSTSGIYHNPEDWRTVIAPDKTLPSLFRRHGYYAAGAGKIYHGGFDRREEWDDYFKPGPGEPVKGQGAAVGALKYRMLEGGDEIMGDHQVVSYCIDQLGRAQDKPFFLACGIYRPHLPWNVPAKYFEMHPLADIELPPFKPDDLEDVPGAGVRIARPEGDHAKVEQAGKWKELVRAYLASISFADAQVGRLIEALDQGAYRDNTIIVLWGDHGWHLGEKRHWRKFSLWEEATRAPLIWVAPGITRTNRLCDTPVDFMNIYPTLADLCGLPIPDHVEGVSLRPLLVDPDAAWNRPALTTHGRNNHAIRTAPWRYIRYADGSEELYDERADPYEWDNLARSAEFEGIKKELGGHLPLRNEPTPATATRRGRGRNFQAPENSEKR